MFEKLFNSASDEMQEKYQNKWEKENLLQKSIDIRDGKEPFIFYEGPPTANGKPGIHHVIARTLKDSVCRYKTMKGFKVERKAGWDTHGLPVEIEVEKQLNLTSKQEIEDYGIENFNEKCRESVFKYEKIWQDMTKKMAYLVDLDNPYITLDNDYIESCFWILKQFFDKGFVYEGHKVLPYCPRCGTGLASHEVAQGYKEIKSLTATVKFKRKGVDEYFLAWTTTPWTLAANVALTVGADIDYLKIKILDGENKGEIYYVCKNRAKDVVDEDYEVLETLKGKDLEYMEYEQLMPFVKPDKKAFFVTLADYVTTDDGTGIVHTAPAFGEDDYNTARRYDIPVLNPVSQEGKYIDTPWKGRNVMDDELAVDIIKYLAKGGLLYSKAKVEHNYPHCWRCKTPLIYYAKPSWYIEMTKLKDELVSNNKTVKWHPDFVGLKRFENWLENVNDWAISRSRYWGTPMPVWRCDSCGEVKCIGSRKELKREAVQGEEDIDTLDLHRPFIDRVKLKCSCGAEMNRVTDVMDCWFDSGSMPFAQFHYPFENEEKFKESFPASFICEGIDQTRGWFYSLMAISTFIMGKAPYKNVLVNDLILDKHGKKMSKSKGNTVDPFELFSKYGSDSLRWYMLYASPAWSPTKFDEEGLKEIHQKCFSTLKNVHTFFALYANQDDVDPLTYDIPVKNRPELDRWIISRFNAMVDYVTTSMDEYDHMKSVRAIQAFITEDLSNWYIRRARRRFWQSEMDDSKKSVYLTTYEMLLGLSKIMAPFTPFISEDMYLKLTRGSALESVHLENYPVPDKTLLEEDIERRMDIVRSIVSIGRELREKTKIKVRRPLKKIIVDKSVESIISDLLELIKEELNVKAIEFADTRDDYMKSILKPNFKVAGPVLGSKIGEFKQALTQIDAKDMISKLDTDGAYKLDLSGESFDISREMLDIVIEAKEGFAAGLKGDLYVILDTEITEELEQEGIAREVVSKVQHMRKTMDLDLMDKIRISMDADAEVSASVKRHEEYIKRETLALDILNVPIDQKEDINGHSTGISIDKA